MLCPFIPRTCEEIHLYLKDYFNTSSVFLMNLEELHFIPIDDENETNLNKVVTAINNMKASNDTKNDAIITALQGLVTKVNQNTNNINSLDGRVDALEQA